MLSSLCAGAVPLDGGRDGMDLFRRDDSPFSRIPCEDAARIVRRRPADDALACLTER